MVGRGFTEWRNVVRAQPAVRGPPAAARPGRARLLRPPACPRCASCRPSSPATTGSTASATTTTGSRDAGCSNARSTRCSRLASRTSPSALAWANENWTRRWDGSDSEVLIAQTYDAGRRSSPHRLAASRRSRTRATSESTARPLFLIYRVQAIARPGRATFDLWRERAAATPASTTSTSSSSTRTGTSNRRTRFGADAAVEFLPHGVYENVRPHHVRDSERWQCLCSGTSTSARLLLEAALTRLDSAVPCVMPEWDNTPRRPEVACSSSSATTRRCTRGGSRK